MGHRERDDGPQAIKALTLFSLSSLSEDSRLFLQSSAWQRQEVPQPLSAFLQPHILVLQLPRQVQCGAPSLPRLTARLDVSEDESADVKFIVRRERCAWRDEKLVK